MPQLTDWQWVLAIVAAFCVGLSKAGFTGIGLAAVVVFASIFGARDSTGVVLPLLIVADTGAVAIFKQHARWEYIRRTLPVACVGIVLATLIMRRLDNASFRPILGGTDDDDRQRGRPVGRPLLRGRRAAEVRGRGHPGVVFFIINLIKVPFSVSLGLIHGSSLVLNALLIPPIFAGLFAGRWLIGRIPQKVFEGLLLTFAAIAALRLVLS